MGLRSSTPPPSAHDRVVGREWGLQPRSRVPKPHLHTHCRDRGSAHRQVSDCETCFLGRVRRVWAGPGRAEPPCHPATLPPLPCAHPSPSRGNPREVPGRMGYPCGAAALEKAFRSASAHKPASCAVARGSISAFAMAGLHSARRGRGAQPHGYSGSSSCCDWRESNCSFSAPQPTTTPSSGMPSVESLYVKAYPAPRRLPRAFLSCPRERALGAELMGPLTRPIGCDITQNPVF